MLFIFGIRRIRIGHYIDTEYLCYPCRSYDHEVSVYRSFFHFCFIPVFPVGRSQIEVHCRNCGDETALDSLVNKYGNRTRTPFYLYSFIILACCVALFWFYWKKHDQKLNADYAQHPAIGDVYTLSSEDHNGTNYSFLKVIRMKDDSVVVLANHFNYIGFVSDLSDDDYFDSGDSSIFRKRDLISWVADGKISSVTRNYGESSHFNHTK
jgi:hypothetical protein